jgi:hypothetical protein
MKRREFLTVGSACLILASGRALAEPSRSWRVALATSGQGDEILGLIRVSLASLGYEEVRTSLSTSAKRTAATPCFRTLSPN